MIILSDIMDTSALNLFLKRYGYVGIFLSGFLYAYAFTATPATLILLNIGSQENLLIAGLVAGLGALLGDLIIFHFLRREFSDEVEKLREEKIIQNLNKLVPDSIRKYLYFFLSSILIASPLPTELGVSLMALTTKISSTNFAVLAYLLHTCGIIALIYLGNVYGLTISG